MTFSGTVIKKYHKQLVQFVFTEAEKEFNYSLTCEDLVCYFSLNNDKRIITVKEATVQN